MTLKHALLAIVALTMATSAFAQAPNLTPLQFDLRAQSQFSGSAGAVTSGSFIAIGGGGPSGPAVAIHGISPESNVTADNEASARALWSFEILGPVGVVVPILIGGLYSAATDTGVGVSGGLALGEDRFRMTNVFSFRCTALDTADCDSSRGGRSQDFTLHQLALSGFETFISIAVGGSVRSPSLALGTFTASLDPLITIDPTFARASEFMLFVSPGAEGAVAAVPEPDTWLLLLAGVATMAGVARRRQRAPR